MCVLCTASQIIGGDFANFVAFSEYMNFTHNFKIVQYAHLFLERNQQNLIFLPNRLRHVGIVLYVYLKIRKKNQILCMIGWVGTIGS